MLTSAGIFHRNGLALGLACASCAFAAHAEPLYDQDNGVFSGMFHYADSTESAVLVAPGRYALSLSSITSSHAVSAESANEVLLLDGETTRVELDVRYGLGKRLEVGFQVPYVNHASGNLDSLIANWHKALGLPQGSRKTRPEDQLRFAYQSGSDLLLDFRSNSDGIGDIRLVAGWQLGNSPRHRSALRVGLKLPTGDGATLLGSGSTDFGIGVAGDARTLFGVGPLRGYYSAFVNYVGEPDLFADRYREVVGQLATGLGYAVSESFELAGQIAARSATYDSGIETLGEPSVALVLGGNIRLSSRYTLSLAFGEDIKVNSAPDFSFQLAIRYRHRNPE